MFGYIQPDIPYTYVKDGVLYKALYCGLCKSIGGSCGHCARFGLSYDMTFLSALLHNIMNTDVQIEKRHCILHPILRRPIAGDDELTRKIACINTVLTYYKLTDDIADEHRGRASRSFFRKGRKRAARLYPRIEEIVRKGTERLHAIERENCDSVDRAADPFADMVAELSDFCLGEYATEHTHALLYGIGKWVYLIDALDDFEKDGKRGNYNPFRSAYGGETRQEMLEKSGGEAEFILRSIFVQNAEHLKSIRFYYNHDLTDNIILRGLPAATRRVLCGCKGKKNKPEKMKIK